MEERVEKLAVVSGRMKDGRRKYDRQAKRALIERCLKGEESIARIAQAHDINANLLHKWITRYRRQGAANGLEIARTGQVPPFIPVVATPPAAPEPSVRRPVVSGGLKAVLPTGIVLEIGEADGARLEALVRTLWTLPCSGSTQG